MRLGVDPRKADQMVRGSVNLPHGTGKTARVIVFAAGEKADEAEAAGADEVGTDELVARIQGGWLEFDAAIATPDQMAKIGRIARILGPRGLMPNPKTGTVTMDVTKAVTEIKGGKITFRVDKHSNLHLIIGKASFSEAAGRQLRRRARRGAAVPSRPRPRASTSRRSPSPPRWAPASRSTRTVTRNFRRGAAEAEACVRGRFAAGPTPSALRHRRVPGRGCAVTSVLHAALAPAPRCGSPICGVGRFGQRRAAYPWPKFHPKTAGHRASHGRGRRSRYERAARAGWTVSDIARPYRPSPAPCALRRGVSRCSAVWAAGSTSLSNERGGTWRTSRSGPTRPLPSPSSPTASVTRRPPC